MARPQAASTTPGCCGIGGRPSLPSAASSDPIAAAPNCSAVSATGSRPRSCLDWATVNAADSTREASSRPSPLTVDPPVALPVIRPTPASETAKPSQATGRVVVRCHAAAMIAISTGTAPNSIAAWLTLVRLTPAFCKITEPP